MKWIVQRSRTAVLLVLAMVIVANFAEAGLRRRTRIVAPVVVVRPIWMGPRLIAPLPPVVVGPPIYSAYMGYPAQSGPILGNPVESSYGIISRGPSVSNYGTVSNFETGVSGYSNLPASQYSDAGVAPYPGTDVSIPDVFAPPANVPATPAAPVPKIAPVPEAYLVPERRATFLPRFLFGSRYQATLMPAPTPASARVVQSRPGFNAVPPATPRDVYAQPPVPESVAARSRSQVVQSQALLPKPTSQPTIPRDRVSEPRRVIGETQTPSNSAPKLKPSGTSDYGPLLVPPARGAQSPTDVEPPEDAKSGPDLSGPALPDYPQ